VKLSAEPKRGFLFVNEWVANERRGSMAQLPESNGFVFDAATTSAMGVAVDQICQRLNVNDARAREVIALWVVDLVGSGDCDPAELCDRVADEASDGRIIESIRRRRGRA
jgi:hypothetical protein